MRFIKGLFLGSLIGVSIGTAISKQQREQLLARLKEKTAPVGRSVSDNIGNIADAVTGQAADAVDHTGGAIVTAIDDKAAS